MEIPKLMSEGRIGGKSRVRMSGGVYPTRPEAATDGRACFMPQKPDFRPRTGFSVPEPGSNRLPICAPRLSLGHDRPFPVPEHLFGAAGELFRPRGPHPGRRP